MLKTCVRIFVIAFIVLPVFAANAVTLFSLYHRQMDEPMMDREFAYKYVAAFVVLPVLSTLFYIAHRVAKSKGIRSQGVLSVLAWVAIAPTLCIVALVICLITLLRGMGGTGGASL